MTSCKFEDKGRGEYADCVALPKVQLRSKDGCFLCTATSVACGKVPLLTNLGVTDVGLRIVPVGRKSVEENRREWCKSRTDAADGRFSWVGLVGLSVSGETGVMGCIGSILGVCVSDRRFVCTDIGRSSIAPNL